ncbi:MAG TPA: glutamate formimidoyltransferase [Gemmatimonadaceae bacterium]|jgi:glutamate formiminotransferase/formiminotetrahydrofolate cyclodeaminase
MPLVECVPNFSEGRRPEVIQAIRDAIAAIPDVIVLDVSSDESHNRSVITFVAPRERAVDAAFAGMRVATERIDLTTHTGEHPRMGATDVVPFVPLDGTTMDECVALARTLGERVGRELEIPVYLYERAASRPARENLADVRRGQFEGIRAEIETNPDRAPDFGSRRVHPTAGAVAIGARPFLVAYNVYLGDATPAHIAAAKRVAKAVRGSSGGLRYVKALGLEVDGQAQVSMNLVDLEQTPAHRAFDMVQMEAAAGGVPVTWSEIVGLVPERVLFDAAARHLQLSAFSPDQVLERRLRAAADHMPNGADLVAAVAAPTPTPGGGSAAAHAGALAAALVQMVAGLTVGRKKFAAVDDVMRDTAARAAALVKRLEELVQLDAESYTAVSAAYKLPKDTNDQRTQRAAAITTALVGASEVPLETARACAAVSSLAALVAEKGNPSAVSDAGVAALLADAACRGAAYNVRVNIAALSDPAAGRALVEAAATFMRDTAAHVTRATAMVDEKM